LYRTLLSEGVVPDQVWGSSLGEYAAAIAAGIWSFESALSAVIEQADLVVDRCPPGGMLAIVAHPDLYARLKNAGHEIVMAGINFANHFTIAGDIRTLDEIQRQLTAESTTFLRLPVSYAFHSAAVDPIRERFIQFLSGLPIARSPRLPVVSSLTTEFVDEFSPTYFWRVVREPMRFSETVARIERNGPVRYIDCGPSGTSATFVKYNLTHQSASSCHPLLTPFHQGAQKIAQLRKQLGVGS